MRLQPNLVSARIVAYLANQNFFEVLTNPLGSVIVNANAMSLVGPSANRIYEEIMAFVRLSVTACLGAILLLGPIPAWIHIADSCDTWCVPKGCVAEERGTTPAVCSACCTAADIAAEGISEDSEKNGGHDHEHCAICRSVFTLFADVVLELPDCHSNLVVKRGFFRDQLVAELSDLEIASPRGPPIRSI